MRNIIIVECMSTGINFVEDIINRGYNPIVLELNVSDTDGGKEHAKLVYEEYERIDYEFDIIYEKDTFEDTLEEVKKYNPLLILPGNERGVILANRLSHELGLLCNPIENLDAITLKHEMQNRIAEKGLRSIKGKVVSSLDEALDFYDGEDLSEVVVKPIYSAGSASVRICMNRDELIKSIGELFNNVNYYGDEIDEILIQERINGEEYIINTVSHKGVHRVTLIWKYHKVKTSKGAIVYDSCNTVNELNLGEAEMVEYAYDVADALGIQYGPVHGEYMIDEKGPVLIEVNCRPCGGNMPAEFLDRISGQHETDSILDSYLRPAHFHENLKKNYELYSYGSLKFFIVPKDMMAHSSPLVDISNRMKSYFDSSLSDNFFKETFFKQTEDLNTSGGTIFLVHEDKAQIEKNLNFLRAVERNAFSLILSYESSEITLEDDEVYLKKIMPLFKHAEKYGIGLFVTDQFIDDVQILQVSPDRLDDIKGRFEFIIINMNKSLIGKGDVEKALIFLNIFSKVITGGYIVIPKSTYLSLSSGRKGMEALIKVLDYKIEVPPYTLKDVIIASKII